MQIQLTKQRDELLAQGQKKQAKEEDWDKRTETLAKVLTIPFCLILPTLILDEMTDAGRASPLVRLRMNVALLIGNQACGRLSLLHHRSSIFNENVVSILS
jgi:hypothetical protein